LNAGQKKGKHPTGKHNRAQDEDRVLETSALIKGEVCNRGRGPAGVSLAISMGGWSVRVVEFSRKNS